MSLSIDELRCKLVNKILMAYSQDEVKIFVDTAIKELEQHNVSGLTICRFVEKLIADFGSFDPMNQDSRQWSNIKMARILVNRISQQLTINAT